MQSLHLSTPRMFQKDDAIYPLIGPFNGPPYHPATTIANEYSANRDTMLICRRDEISHSDRGHKNELFTNTTRMLFGLQRIEHYGCFCRMTFPNDGFDCDRQETIENGHL